MSAGMSATRRPRRPGSGHGSGRPTGGRDRHPGARPGSGCEDSGVSELAPYDGVLLVSFGGPEGPDDVMPFLRAVTRGRPVPPERLEAVAEHYLAVGGRSPINDANRRLLAELQAELDGRGIQAPVIWGNRNWHPLLPDALDRAHESGLERLVAIVTSLFPSWSGCRQYRMALAAAVREGHERGVEVEVDVVAPYHARPGIRAALVDRVDGGLDALGRLLGVDPGQSAAARVVFVTHSIPVEMDLASGPLGSAYSGRQRQEAHAVMQQLGARRGGVPPWDLVFCSRSGPPGQPWLEPDIDDHLVELAGDGVEGVVVVPIGFVSDHMEVVHDLDTQAAEVARRVGMSFVRVPTVGTDPRFVAALADAVLDQAALARGERPTLVPATCTPQCCHR